MSRPRQHTLPAPHAGMLEAGDIVEFSRPRRAGERLVGAVQIVAYVPHLVAIVDNKYTTCLAARARLLRVIRGGETIATVADPYERRQAVR